MVGDDYDHFITADWDYGFRASRIVEMLQNALGKIDIAYFQKMHGDDYDAGAATLVPILMNVDLNDSHLDETRALLKNWDYQAQADSSAAALYEVFWKHLLAKTFHDELPERYWPTGGDRWFEVTRNMNESSVWWDDKSTSDVVETRHVIFSAAFKDAVAEIEKTLGKDPSKWKWGDLHGSVFRSGSLGQSGVGLIENLFNRGPFPTSGGNSIVNATGWRSTEGYETTTVPSMRAIYDLSDLNNSLTVHTTGQSGHAYHSHYIDMPALWAAIQYYPMWWNQEDAIRNAEGHLVLKP
jgi:penicillin amidase